MRGLTLLLTGLPAAGKTTLANALVGRLALLSCKAKLFDGDLLRAHAEKPLGFSRTDRDRQVARATELAANVVARGGTAICALIAPYATARIYARERLSVLGAFYEIYLSTTLEICERRDPKGLYAAARAGKVLNFTGVSDPYEAPVTPELRLDLGWLSLEQAVSRVVVRLSRDGVLSADQRVTGAANKR